MVRKTLRLTDIQARRHEELAQREKTSVSALVCRGVDIVLQTHARQEIRGRAAEAVGLFSSGDRDVSVRHDEYLAKAEGE